MQIQQFYTLNQIIIETLAENSEANNNMRLTNLNSDKYNFYNLK